jgi:predicted DCC family thiol-disulfide oxidoreductase YuxK
VRFIAARDPDCYFRFGASQSPRAAGLLAQYGLTREMTRSIVLIEDDRVYLQSTASLRIARRLTAPWAKAGALLAVPRPLRDAVYRAIALVRHRLAGRTRVCEVPPPEIRGRMI